MTAPARMLHLVGEAEYRDEAEAKLAKPGDATLVVRGRTRSVVMACPDGCGETLVVNIDPRAGKAWRMDTRGEGLTLYPSVWRDGGCRSHFIVWRGFLIWCDRFILGNQEPRYDPSIEEAVLSAMDVSTPLTAEVIAYAIDELVYDVNRAANRLVGYGLARSWKESHTWFFVRAD